MNSNTAKTYRMGTDALIQDLGPTYRALLKKNRIPTDLLFDNLKASDIDVLSGIADMRSENATSFEKFLKGENDRFRCNLENSFVIRHNNQVIAFVATLWDASKESTFVYMVGVRRGYRNGWANVVIKYQSAVKFREAGYRYIEFMADDTQRDAQSHAKRSNATAIY